MVITAVAVAFIYLYVVPQLESSLTAETLSSLERRGNSQLPLLEGELGTGGSEEEVSEQLNEIASTTGAQVTLLSVREFPGPDPGPPTALVISDPEQALSSESAAIADQAASGETVTGIGVSTGGKQAVVAIPFPDPDPAWVALFSEPLSEVEANVSRIRGQILFAVAIALVLALITGFIASRYLARRLGQLAEAAGKAADGNFATQVPVGPADEVGEVARAFNEMQIRLADLERARRQFIANASHELRTPIFSLGGFVELLDEEDLDPETQAAFVRSMRDQIDRLTKLTADLLDLSKLDSGAIRFQPRRLDLNLLASEVASEFGPIADRHQSRLEVRTPENEVVAMADPQRTRQIIRILLDNALTHTPSGTKVTVTTMKQGARATLTVFDQGPGIPKHVQSRMFDRFYTADETGGSGLGLSIARSLAMRMNGQLSFTARRGTTSFTIDLPEARVPTAVI